jgi:chromosome segregation ATPase
MKNVLKNIIALVILGTVIFLFWKPIERSIFALQDRYFPCSRAISYSIGSFDTSFGITKDDFLSAIKESENMWEATINKDLFVYDPSGNGELKINLVYDARQATTQKLKNIDKNLENDKSFYDNLKSALDTRQTDYNQKKATLESMTITRDNIAEINALRTELNTEADQINALVAQINASATTFNNEAKNYNTVGSNLGEQFEEGVYVVDQAGKHIDIYQFENKEKLARVLMHEMGHALGLDHLANPNAIMYALNNGVNAVPTADDINALKAHCGIK